MGNFGTGIGISERLNIIYKQNVFLSLEKAEKTSKWVTFSGDKWSFVFKDFQNLDFLKFECMFGVLAAIFIKESK